MKAGSWSSILGIYLFGVCGASTVSKIIPLSGDISQNFGLAPADFGWLVALIAVPAAIFAIPSGMVVDRFGARRVLLFAGLLAILANAVYYFAPTLQIIRLARLMEGLAIVHIYTAGPAMLMASTDGDKRTRAMTLWSTYAPVGTAVGLIVGGLFAEGLGWRNAFLANTGMYAVAIVLSLFLPNVITSIPGQVTSLKERVIDLGSAFSRPMLLSLAIGFFLIISMGLGANVTFPDYLAGVHSISVHESSNMVASMTLAMILGSLMVGILLPKGIKPHVLYTVLAVVGFLAGIACFYPPVSSSMRYLALFSWFTITGAAMASVLAMLPKVAEPGRQGAAAALINFAGAIATFINPPIWLGISAGGQWTPFIGLLAFGWVVSVALIWGAAILYARSQREA